MADLLVYGDSGVDPADANSYVSTDEADTYFDNRFNIAWQQAPDPEAALIKATAYVDARYRSRWRGKRATQEQALAWPRKDVTDSDGYDIDEATIPRAVKEATFEAALRAISGELYKDWNPSESTVTSQSDTVGPISSSKTFKQSVEGQQPIYAIIDALLAPLITSGAVTFLHRA